MDDQAMFGMIPEGALPPAEVRIQSLRAEALPDGRRVRVYLELTPFRQRPNLLVWIFNASGDEVARVDIVESMNARMVFTMHLRVPEPAGQYLLRAHLIYPDLEATEDGIVDRTETAFEISAAA